MENLDAQLHGLVSIVVAAVLAAFPGMDRERRHRPAGLRTHMLVAISSTMITVMARIEFSPDSAARLVANILTGIGFLGAGVILQRKGYVYDITSAASLWMVALLGIVVGYEQYVLSFGSTLILVFVLSVLRKVEDKKDIPPPNDNPDKSTTSNYSRLDH